MKSLTVAVLARVLQQSHAGIKYMAWDGCSQMPGNFHEGTTRGMALDSVDNTAAVRCCKDTASGVTCETDVNSLCNSGKTWAQAKSICESNGHRLCTLPELQSNICCNTGCNYDYMTNIWTSTQYRTLSMRAPCPGTDGRTNEINYTAIGLTGLGIALCYDANDPNKFKECSSVPMIYPKAQECCAGLTPGTWNIPSLGEMDDALMCATGILTDKNKYIWSRDEYEYSGWVAADGCKIRNYGSNSVTYGSDDYYYNTFESHAVRCCSYDGSMCTTTTRLGCESSVSWLEAHAACHEQGLRLCSKAEMQSYKCCVTGCMFDVDRVWTSTLKTHYRGAKKNITGTTCNYEEDLSSTSTNSGQGFGTVCCTSGGSCVDPVPGTCTMKATPADVQKHCHSMGHEMCRDSRLCSRCKSTKCYTNGVKMAVFKTYVY